MTIEESRRANRLRLLFLLDWLNDNEDILKDILALRGISSAFFNYA
ncbi:hypothetical protein [Xylanibacter rodentium]|nr:hypothetical protein [Xylanibacter rodentium]